MIQVTRWRSSTEADRRTIEDLYAKEGLDPYSWSNSPGDVYGAHSHSYHKVLYCLRGSITFNVEGEDVELRPGDRLDIAPGVLHSAVVGVDGVTCLEASR